MRNPHLNHPPKKSKPLIVSAAYDHVAPSIVGTDTLKFHYIVFTDIQSNLGCWEKAKSDFAKEKIGSRLRARNVKTQLHRLVDVDSRKVIWRDARIVVDDSRLYGEFENFIESGADIGLVRHPERIYAAQELNLVEELGLQEPHMPGRELLAGAKSVFLFESGLIFYRDIHCDKIKAFLDDWNSWINAGYIRDQTSLPHLIEKHKLSVHLVWNGLKSARDSGYSCVYPRDAKVSQAYLDNIARTLIANRRIHSDKGLTQSRHRPKVDILMPVFNALPVLRMSVESLQKNLTSDTRLVIMNDGSNHEVSEYLNSIVAAGSIYVLNAEYNRGYTVSVNHLLLESIADVQIVVNSDVIISRNVIHKISREVLSEKAGVVGTLSNSAGPQSVNFLTGNRESPTRLYLGPGSNLDSISSTLEQLFHDASPIKVPWVHGSLWGISRKTREEVGLLDEILFPIGNGEEIDYGIRAQTLGYENQVIPNAFYFHFHSASFEAESKNQSTVNGLHKLKNRYSDLEIKEKNLMENLLPYTFAARAALLLRRDLSKELELSWR